MTGLGGSHSFSVRPSGAPMPSMDSFHRQAQIHSIPRLGFIGAGWIGRSRIQTVLSAQEELPQPLAHFLAVYDPSYEAAKLAASLVNTMEIYDSIDALLKADLDGVVIATPSAFHANQCVAALEAGKAVFCQKPLARTAAETMRVIGIAQKVDRLLAVDFSYRYLKGIQTLRDRIRTGELGEIYAADLVFHNAYGPEKPWFYDMSTSGGGGCVMDLGIHLVDMALWLLGRRDVRELSSTLFHKGKRLRPPYDTVEDFANAEFGLGDTRVRLTCSWNLHAGQDAIISAHFYGTKGGASVRNINGSFFDFEIHRFEGSTRSLLAGHPDSWGGRALQIWIRRLSQNCHYDPEVEQVLKVAHLIDRIYCR